MADEKDCGDNSCLYANKKGGMRTNGGCRCDQCEGCGYVQREGHPQNGKHLQWCTVAARAEGYAAAIADVTEMLWRRIPAGDERNMTMKQYAQYLETSGVLYRERDALRADNAQLLANADCDSMMLTQVSRERAALRERVAKLEAERDEARANRDIELRHCDELSNRLVDFAKTRRELAAWKQAVEEYRSRNSITGQSIVDRAAELAKKEG